MKRTNVSGPTFLQIWHTGQFLDAGCQHQFLALVAGTNWTCSVWRRRLAHAVKIWQWKVWHT